MIEFDDSVHFRPIGQKSALRGGDPRMVRGVQVGHHERSGAAVFLAPDGLKRRTRIARLIEHERQDRESHAS